MLLLPHKSLPILTLLILVTSDSCKMRHRKVSVAQSIAQSQNYVRQRQQESQCDIKSEIKTLEEVGRFYKKKSVPIFHRTADGMLKLVLF